MASYQITPFICALAATVLGCAVEARAAEWFDLNDKALATIDFEGLAVPSTVEQLHKQFPKAKRDHQRVDDEIGLECYEVGDLANVDRARFYYCDGRLYQLELVYESPRVEKLGGMRAVVQKLIDTWGPADHVGESRWTWQRPMYQRRADFYARPELGQLTITDSSWMQVVQARIARQRDRIELGL